MMKRKFSFDLPARLKIGPLRPDAGKATWKDPSSASLDAPWMDSQPPTPKSVRPPLPGDIDAELRAACNWIVTHPKPSHEIWDTSTSKPALDYRAIKYAETAPVSSVPAPAKGHSLRSKEPSKHELLPDSTKYSYRPNVPAEDLFRPADVATKTARSRVEQLMAPEAPRPVAATTGGRQRSASHSHSHSHSATTQQQVARAETAEKKRTSTRSDSVGTSGSTPHTDSTEYPWTASTAMTSAVMTPSRSKRASSQALSTGLEGGTLPKAKADAINAEWMRLELEKHFRTQEKCPEKEQQEPVLCSATYIPSGASPHYSRDFSHVPARKPLPSCNANIQAGRVSRPENGHDGRERSSPTPRGRTHNADRETRGRSPPRSYSRIGRASRAASRAASVAATQAGSIANEIFVHLDLRPRQPSQAQREATRSSSKAPSRAFSRGPTRPPSRVRSISRHVKEYFRPGSDMSIRQGSVNSGESNTATSEETSERGRGWHLLKRGRSTFDLSRPGSAASHATNLELQSPQYGKAVVDLNRELPPLPGLDKWEGGPEREPSSSLNTALSKMDITKNPHGTRTVTQSSRNQPPPGSMVNLDSPETSDFQKQSPNWRSPPSDTRRREFKQDTSGQNSQSGTRRELPQSQCIPRPQTRGMLPASNRNGFVDPDSAATSPRFSPATHHRDPDSNTLSSSHTRESYFHFHRDELRSSSRHQRSPTLNEKVRRKWWPGSLRRSPSQASRMDSVIRPAHGMPTAH